VEGGLIALEQGEEKGERVREVEIEIGCQGTNRRIQKGSFQFELFQDDVDQRLLIILIITFVLSSHL
jgi:hypothetical protein